MRPTGVQIVLLKSAFWGLETPILLLECLLRPAGVQMYYSTAFWRLQASILLLEHLLRSMGCILYYWSIFGGDRCAIFITGVPFVVYWGKSCITEVPFWGYRRQFYYWAALLRSVYCGAKLYYCSPFGLTGSNFITGVLFEVYWGTKCITAGDSVIKLDPVAPKGSSVIRYTYNVKL